MPALSLGILFSLFWAAPLTQRVNWDAMFRVDRFDLLIPDIVDTRGAAFRDVDGDGLPDLYLVCYRSFNRLLVNRGEGLPFVDETVASGLGGNLMPMGDRNVELSTAIFDLDNDGDGDVVIAGWGLTTRLFRNLGGRRFEPDDEALDIPDYLSVNQVAGADVNRDGYIDLFLADEALSNRLLLSDGGRRFRDATRASGLEGYGRSFDAAFGDVDGDGSPDLYVANGDGPDFFYRNRGDGRFVRKRLAVPLLSDSLSSTSAAFGDVDNDGDLDLFVAGPGGAGRLLVNATPPGDTTWAFTERPLDGETDSWDGVFADFDQDGWLDLFVAGQGPNALYINQGGRLVLAWTETLAPDDLGNSMGAACGDYDLDGDPDLFVANQDTFSLFYPNPLSSASYLRVAVEGVRTNRDGIGARVRFFRPGGRFSPEDFLAMREIGTGGGYLASQEPVAHVGLDTLRRVDVSVRFPSGREVFRLDVAAGQTIRISEYGPLPRTALRIAHRVSTLLRRPDAWKAAALIVGFLAATALWIVVGLRRYQWTPRTATLILAFFFFMAYGAIFALSSLGLVRTFLLIDGLTLVSGGVMTWHFERMLRLRRLRDRDRAVLIRLTHEIVEIRDAEALLGRVADHLIHHSEFEKAAVILTESGEENFRMETRGFPPFSPEEAWPRLASCLGSQTWCPLPEDDTTNAQWLLAIRRESVLYGLMLLGGRRNPGPLSEEDRELYASMAGQMAIALENIRFIRESNEMIQRLTEAEVRQRYLEELERANARLDEKNQELTRLYDELKAAESQLIQTEKMASLGQLVAGIAHELNNPVGFIYANVQQLGHYLAPIQAAAQSPSPEADALQRLLPDLQGLIEDTLRGSRAVKSLVENLRTFSHLDQAEMTETDIHEGLETSLIIAGPQLKPGITVEKDFRADGRIEAHPGQLNQVFLNLIVNAAQAMAGQGRLSLRTWDQDGGVAIEVADTGPGIDEAVRAKIFDPFFTTKEIGQGMGLGLSISYAIVQKHGGRIFVESPKGQGARFMLWLPGHAGGEGAV